jgi:hypothetical protein
MKMLNHNVDNIRTKIQKVSTTSGVIIMHKDTLLTAGRRRGLGPLPPINFVYFYVLKIFFKEFKEFYFIFILN